MILLRSDGGINSSFPGFGLKIWVALKNACDVICIWKSNLIQIKLICFELCGYHKLCIVHYHCIVNDNLCIFRCPSIQDSYFFIDVSFFKINYLQKMLVTFDSHWYRINAPQTRGYYIIPLELPPTMADRKNLLMGLNPMVGFIIRVPTTTHTSQYDTLSRF